MEKYGTLYDAFMFRKEAKVLKIMDSKMVFVCGKDLYNYIFY